MIGGKSGTISLEKQFWEWFAQNQDIYFYLEAHDLDSMDLLASQLKQVHEHLTFDLTEIDAHGRRDLIISADGLHTSFPAVIKLVEAAPYLPQWNVIPFRQASPVDTFRIRIGDTYFHSGNVKFSFDVAQCRLMLNLFVTHYDTQPEHYDLGCMILIDTLLGEYEAATKIFFLDIKDTQEAVDYESLPSLEVLPILLEDVNQGKVKGSIPVVPTEHPSSKDPYHVQDHFVLMRNQEHGFPHLVLINSSYYTFTKKHEFPWLLSISFPYEPAEEGLPTSAKSDELIAKEQKLLDILAPISKAYFIYRSTWNGTRILHIHLNNWPEIEHRFQDSFHQAFAQASFEIAYEKDWETVRAMLVHLKDAEQNMDQ
ncbi:MAG: DUF695 domain-containing protein [Bacteroidota bacterium]